MSLDKEVENAIVLSVQELGQQEKVAKRLSSWLKDLSERELTPDENLEHFEVLKNSIDNGVMRED